MTPLQFLSWDIDYLITEWLITWEDDTIFPSVETPDKEGDGEAVPDLTHFGTRLQGLSFEHLQEMVVMEGVTEAVSSPDQTDFKVENSSSSESLPSMGFCRLFRFSDMM